MRKDRKHIVDIFNLNYQLTVPKRVKGKIEQRLCIEPEDNKYFQNIAWEFSNKTFSEYVKKLREERQIDIVWFNNCRQEWDKLLNVKYDASVKVSTQLNPLGLFGVNMFEYEKKRGELELSTGFTQARDKLQEHTEKSVAWADKRLTFEDAERIRYKFNFPPNWEGSIIHYILTGELIAPDSEDYEPIYRNGGILGFTITIYGDSTENRMRVLYRRIAALRPSKAVYVHKKDRDIYQPQKAAGKIDQYVVSLIGFPTIRRLIAALGKCQKMKMRGKWIRGLRTGGNLKEQFRMIKKFEEENPLGKFKDYSTGRLQSLSARSIINPREYARIRKLKERIKDHVNIF